MKKILLCLLCGIFLFSITGCGKKQIFSDYLIEQANDSKITNYKDGKISEMYTFKHDKTEQTGELIDYRYIGNKPNNYVEFNGETWRIIGVFTVDNLKKVKIIKESPIGNFSWDDEYNYGMGRNNWSKSTLNSTVLNGRYYYSIDYTYIDSITRDSQTEYFSESGLTKETQEQISATTYYLGGVPYSNHGDGSNLYSLERSTKVYGNNPTNEIRNIGLMYPSDFAYTFSNGVNDVCYNDLSGCNNFSSSWLDYIGEEWLISPSYDNNKAVYAVDSGYFRSEGDESRVEYYAKYSCAVRPVVYLRHDIKVSDGDGTEDNPYIIVE